MMPVSFPEQNKTLLPGGTAYSSNVGDVKPLGVWTDGEQCVSCWRPSWKERLSILVFGRVWLSILTGQTQPPAYIEGSRTYFLAAEEARP